jgi:RNA polymerase sigma-70 factor (ECF subfamily)
MPQLTDGELIDLGRRGETAAIGELFQRHYALSLKVARRILRCEAESQDAVQAAYCAAFEHLDTFRGESSFRTWITRIVVNRCLMALRHPWRQRRVSSHIAPEGELLHDFVSPARTPEMCAWNQEVAGALERAFYRLPPPLRAAYTLYALSEMPVSEVAASLGLTVPAAKSRIFRARNAMRLSLENVEHDWNLSRGSAGSAARTTGGNLGNAYVI